MKAIRYSLELEQPVLATDLQGEPNSAVSMPYLPGSLLRGALAARYVARRGAGFDAAEDPRARGLFLTERSRFLNAYPERDGERALPTPASWKYDKRSWSPDSATEVELYNLSRVEPPDDFQGKSAPGRFVWLGGSTATLYSPERRISVHTQRDARRGRATEEAGAVYRYEALEAGQRFQALLLAEDELAAEAMELLDGAELWLGRARRAGYGLARVVGVAGDAPVAEIERHDPLAGCDAGEPLQITFTSDAILRDDEGRLVFDPGIELARRLGVGLRSESGRSFVATGIVGGFNRKWGLPLPQTQAVRAGSVFSFVVDGDVGAEALEELERVGIGERLGEGFGRLVVDWHTDDVYYGERARRLRRVAPPQALAAAEADFARDVAGRLLRAALERQLEASINARRITGEANKHQLARLRGVLREALGAGHAEGADVARLTRYLQRLRGRRSSADRFATVMVDDAGRPTPLLKWIEDQMGAPLDLWHADPVRLGRGAAAVARDVDETLALAYTLRLLDGLLYRKMKES